MVERVALAFIISRDNSCSRQDGLFVLYILKLGLLEIGSGVCNCVFLLVEFSLRDCTFNTLIFESRFFGGIPTVRSGFRSRRDGTLFDFLLEPVDLFLGFGNVLI